MGAVLTHVIESPQIPFPVAHHGDGLTRDLGGDIGPWLPHLFNMADPLPGFGKDQLLISLKPLIGRIGLRLEREGRGRVRIKPCTNAREIELGNQRHMRSLNRRG